MRVHILPMYALAAPNNVVAALRTSAMEYVGLNISDRDGKLRLSNIRVPRLHYLDRRHFNITVTSMVDKIDSRYLIEWLIYHILLGVEHFLSIR